MDNKIEDSPKFKKGDKVRLKEGMNVSKLCNLKTTAEHMRSDLVDKPLIIGNYAGKHALGEESKDTLLHHYSMQDILWIVPETYLVKEEINVDMPKI